MIHKKCDGLLTGARRWRKAATPSLQHNNFEVKMTTVAGSSPELRRR
jgi:hypothetical protein